jgi:hypothetical protein
MARDEICLKHSAATIVPGVNVGDPKVLAPNTTVQGIGAIEDTAFLFGSKTVAGYKSAAAYDGFNNAAGLLPRDILFS